MNIVQRSSYRALATVALVGTLALGGVAIRSAAQAEKARVVPTPTQDEAAGAVTSEVAVLAGGCFWGVQGVYQHVKGVTSAVSGYAGGQQNTAQLLS